MKTKKIQDWVKWCLAGDLYKCPVLSSGRMMMMMTMKYTGYTNYNVARGRGC